MIVEIGGGCGGFKYYMENGIKIGRDFHRNQLDQRIPLFGDLNVFELSISLHYGDGRTYDHITISFSEHHVSNEMLLIAVSEFLDHALFAWPGSDRNRIPTYAEVHRPRMLSYTNRASGVNVERFIHIHIGIGRHDLLTGAAIEPLGYLGSRTDNLKYIDAWQESFNARYGFASPKVSPRAAAFNGVDVISRLNNQKHNKLVSLHGKRAALEATLQKEIVELNITTWIDLGSLLAVHGVVSIVNQGRFGECYSVKLPDVDVAIRLKGVFFQRQFIELTTDEKVGILRQREKPAYLEQMSPRKEPSHVTAILSEWQQFKAKEFRYVNTGTPFYKNVYLPASFEARLTILNDLEGSRHGITRNTAVKSRAIATSASHLPALQIRDLDGIRGRTEMLLQGDWRVDVRTTPTGVTVGSPLRRADSRGDDSVAIIGDAISELDVLSFDYLAIDEFIPESQNRIVQSSSVLELALADIRERDERATAKAHYGEIEKWLDCDLLLASLKVSHGLNPFLYRIVTAQDGTVQIHCGSRSITPSEFLTEELGLPWRDAAPILQFTHEHQIHSQAAKHYGNVAMPRVRQAATNKRLDGEVTDLDNAAKKNHQNVELIVNRKKIGVDDGLGGKATTKPLGATYRSVAKKLSRRGSDYGI